MMFLNLPAAANLCIHIDYLFFSGPKMSDSFFCACRLLELEVKDGPTVFSMSSCRQAFGTVFSSAVAVM